MECKIGKSVQCSVVQCSQDQPHLVSQTCEIKHGAVSFSTTFHFTPFHFSPSHHQYSYSCPTDLKKERGSRPHGKKRDDDNNINKDDTTIFFPNIYFFRVFVLHHSGLSIITQHGEKGGKGRKKERKKKEKNATRKERRRRRKTAKID